MDPTNQRLETGYETIHVDVWRSDFRLSDGAIYTKFFTDSSPANKVVHDNLGAYFKSFTVYNLGASYKVSKEVTLNGAINNLTGLC